MKKLLILAGALAGVAIIGVAFLVLTKNSDLPFLHRFDTWRARIEKFTDEHHQKNHSEKQSRRRKVLRCNQQADNTCDNHDTLKSFRTGPFFILSLGEDKGSDDDHGHFRHLRRLELDTHEGHPACSTVDAFHHHNETQ